jgi:hypothetical protein
VAEKTVFPAMDQPPSPRRIIARESTSARPFQRIAILAAAARRAAASAAPAARSCGSRRTWLPSSIQRVAAPMDGQPPAPATTPLWNNAAAARGWRRPQRRGAVGADGREDLRRGRASKSHPSALFCFWGGVYGAAFGRALPRLPRRVPLWLLGLGLGVLALLVLWFIVAPTGASRWRAALHFCACWSRR